MTYEHDELAGEIYIHAGLFDEADRLVPDRHAYVTSKLFWMHLEDGLTKFEETTRPRPETIGRALGQQPHEPVVNLQGKAELGRIPRQDGAAHGAAQGVDMRTEVGDAHVEPMHVAEPLEAALPQRLVEPGVFAAPECRDGRNDAGRRRRSSSRSASQSMKTKRPARRGHGASMQTLCRCRSL